MQIQSVRNYCTLMLLVGAGLLLLARPGNAAEPTGKPATATAPVELEQRIEVLTEEVQQLKDSLVLPETDALKSYFGLGPAASKIYGAARGISIGGYGELVLQKFAHDQSKGDRDLADALRYVQYLGYKFTDKLLVNAEIELEHASTEENAAGKSGAVELEFLYLDALLHRRVNLRAGLMLMPVGLINEMHEPAYFHGNARPEVERAILPSTWSELGVGAFGELARGLTYKLYLTTGLNAAHFAASGWREGRQGGNRASAEDFAGVLRLDYDLNGMLLVGGSLYYGGADHGAVGKRVDALLAEAHAQLRYRGLELRALGAYGHLSNAAALTQFLGNETLVASSVYGWYAEAAYDVWPLLSRRAFYLAPFVRYEMLNTQAGTPEVAGLSADDNFHRWIVDAGLTVKPHPQVVLKLNFRENVSKGSGRLPDAFYLGAGFVY